MPYFYISSAIILFFAFCVYFHPRFKIAISFDVLQLKGNFCITFLRLKTICYDFSVEHGCFVIYDKKGVPVYHPVNWPQRNPAEFKTRIFFPIADKIRYRSVCMTTELGIANNAAATVMGLSLSRLVYDIAFSLLKSKNESLKLCRELVPVYGKNRIKIDFSGIFIISLANIIIYGALTLFKANRRKAAIDRKEKENADENKRRILENG